MRVTLAVVPRRFTVIESPLSVADCARALEAVTDVEGISRWWGDPRFAFRGWIALDTFRIARILRHRNSFRPDVRGRMEPTAFGTTIHLDMRLPEIVFAFLGLWGAGVLVGLGAVVVGLVSGQVPPHPMMLVPLALVAHGAILLHVPFRREAPRTEAAIAEVVQGTVVASEG